MIGLGLAVAGYLYLEFKSKVQSRQVAEMVDKEIHRDKIEEADRFR